MRLSRSIIALLLASTSLTAQLQWVTNPANGHRYAITPVMDWLQAEALAVNHGGHLATIRNQAEQTWIENNMWGGRNVWIGFNDLAVEGQWQWTSGEPVTFINWGCAEPNNIGGATDYGMIFESKYCPTKWNDEFLTRPNMIGLIEVGPAASYTTYRQSCQSSVGMPQLTATPPHLGKPWTLTVTQLNPNTVGHLFFALDDKFMGINALPLDLASIGAPGCFVNVNTVPRSGTITAWLPSNSVGVAVATIGIPSDPAVLGFEFYNQYVSLDAPAGRGLQLTTTNAGKGVVGR